MKTSFGILKRDLLALLKNPIALLVVGALLVLPGLYAWYCIIANWDPYSNTGRMPIAVVNNDKGAVNSLAGEINIGKQVTDQLKDNDSIDWRFYDSEEEALNDTKRLNVYAALVIPEDLSENLLGIMSGSGKTPSIYYYPNEKRSAVAVKVTDSAAQTLIKQINRGFSSTVNKKILESSQSIIGKIGERTDKVNDSAMSRLRGVQDDIATVVATLDDVTSSIEGWRQAAQGANAALGATVDQLPAIRSSLQRGSEELDVLREKTDGFEGDLSAAILKSASTVSGMSSKTKATLDKATEDLEAIKKRLAAAAKAAGDDESLKIAIEAIESVTGLVENVVANVDGRVTEIDVKVQDATESVSTATNGITYEVMPRLNEGSYKLATSLSRLAGAVEQFEPQVASLQNVLTQTDSALESATASIADAKSLLSIISVNLGGTVTDIGAIGSALEVQKITELMHADPENVGEFISLPVHMATETISPVSNYGTAVAPFYTNLALWVGCFILVSLMKVEVNGFPGANVRQRYFGRWLLFVALSLLQSQVICGVDILLGIDCAHPALFMLSGAVCSFAYMNLIYALTKTFRNVGKTFCILLLIMQVPGSSGMYPIQIMPDFFQAIHPALPFTYGIDAMREALCGMYGLAYVRDLLILLLIVPISLFIGLLLRPFMTNLLAMFDEEMNKVGFFATEKYDESMRSDRFRAMFRALRAHESFRDDIEERAWRFNRVYKRLRRLLSIVTCAIPFAFLVLMLPLNLSLNLSIDTKIHALIIMLVVLFIAMIGLIILENMHRSIVAETQLIAAEILGDSGFDILLDGADDNAPFVVPEQKGNPAADIFFTDLRLGSQSAIGVVVIMLLVITPSLYCWFNDAGSWDPYSATGNLKVAVANEDAGYKGDLIPITINIGDTVVSQLHANTNFNWVFVSKEQAVEGVKSSEYYAAIEIPSNFSSSMLTYLTDNASHPDVVYYTNEKENPIAPLITQKGADSIQESIRVSFTERVDEVALSVAYDVLAYVTDPKRSDYVAKMDRHLSDATTDIHSATRQLRSLSALSNSVSGILDTAGATIDGMKGTSDSAKAAVKEAESGILNSSEALDEAVSIVRELIGDRELDVSGIKMVIDTALDLLESGSEAVPDRIDNAIARVREFRNEHASDKQLKSKLNAIIEELKIAKKHAKAVPGDIAAAREKTDGLIDGAVAEVDEVKAFFNNEVAPSMEELRSTIGGLSASTSEVVNGLERALDGIGASTGGLSNQMTTLSNGLIKVSDRLDSAANSIDDTKKRVREALASGDVQQIKNVILGNDPETLAGSLAAPIKEEREAFYPVANFGSAMAPFYTVLSLWVGALVMISTMRVYVDEERMEELRRRYPKVVPRHEFFGRYGIFGFVGILQSTLVLLGDLLLLHIQCVHPVLFFVFGIFIGQAFCIVVYTLTDLFGDVGKALCVILLIMQVAASGGTFPVQMLDPLLSGVVPFLPFHHAMNLLQECVAGIYWPSVGQYCIALLVMVGVALLVALPLRRPFRKLNDFFEEQLEKTGFM